VVAAILPAVAVLPEPEVSPHRAEAAEVQHVRSPAASEDPPAGNEDSPAVSEDSLAANEDSLAARAAESIAIVAAIEAAIEAGHISDTMALRIITAATTVPPITVIIVRPATTINGAAGFRAPPATILTTTLISRALRQRVERVARRFGAGGR
jgi:hypothetical protein